MELAKKLGVHEILNITNIEDSAFAVKAMTEGGRGADIVIEATGLINVWESSVKMARKAGFVLLFGGTKEKSILSLLHYSQITVKGVFHTTPRHVQTALELLKMGVIQSDDFIQKEYPLEELEEAILEHAAQKVIKNCIVY